MDVNGKSDRIDCLGVEAVRITRRSRDTRRTRRARRSIDAIQVHIVHHAGSECSPDVRDTTHHHHSQTGVVCRDGTLEPIQRIGGINDRHAITRHIRQLRCNRECQRIALCNRGDDDGSPCSGVEAVAVSRWTRVSRGSRGSCGARWAVNAVQVHVVHHVGAECSPDVCDVTHNHHA